MNRRSIPGLRIAEPSAVTAVLILMLLAVADGQASTSRDTSGRTNPSAFAISTPEEQGMDSELLASSIEYLLGLRDLYNIHTMTVIRHGHLVADLSVYPFQPGELHDLASTAKVVLSTVVGIAVDKGYIGGVDDRVVDYFPDHTIANLDSRKRAMTVEHLLTMTSGLVNVDDDDCTSDLLQCALDLPMAAEPGTTWDYAWAPPVLLSGIIQRTTGMNVQGFAREHLFEPVGVANPRWEADPGGFVDAGVGLMITPHDLATFGQLIVEHGSWNGRQVVSEAWLDRATAIHFGDFYGYFWSFYREFPSFFTGGGGMGQRLVVSPEHDLVVAYTGFGYAHEDIEVIYLESLRSYILPAIQSAGPLPPNPTGNARLAEVIERARENPREPGPVPPLPETALEVSGQTIVFDVPGEMATCRLDFSVPGEAVVSVTGTDGLLDQSPFAWAAGLDGIERFALSEFGILTAGTGEWRNDTTFVMNIDGLGSLLLLQLTFAFDGDQVSLTIEDLWWFEPEDPVTLSGRVVAEEPAFPVEILVGGGQFKRSEGIAFNGEGDLYVTGDSALWRVGTRGQVARVADMWSNLGVAAVGDRDLLVADFGPTNAFDDGPNSDGIVWRVTPEGETSTAATGIGDPNFVLVRDDGSFLVSDDAVDEIWIVETDGTSQIFTESIAHPNGMVISPDGSTLYVAQTFDGIDPMVWDNRIWSLPLRDGAPDGNPEVLVTTGSHLGPDGLAMDELGRLYVAANRTGAILRIDPADQSVDEIANNLPGVASLAFGQGDFDHHAIYATSTRTGTVWKIDVGVTGAAPSCGVQEGGRSERRDPPR